jgi:hypothetical protein
MYDVLQFPRYFEFATNIGNNRHTLIYLKNVINSCISSVSVYFIFINQFYSRLPTISL